MNLDPNQIDISDYINDGGFHNEYYRWNQLEKNRIKVKLLGLIFKENGPVKQSVWSIK